MTYKDLDKLIEEFDRFQTSKGLMALIEGSRQIRYKTNSIDAKMLSKITKRIENWINGVKATKYGTLDQK